MNRLLIQTLGLCLIGGSATVSQAAFVIGDVINVDLQSPNANSVDAAGNDGPYSQTGASNWNIVSGWGSDGTPMGLLDAGGQDDGITFSIPAQGAWYSGNYSSASANGITLDYFQENGKDSEMNPIDLPFSIGNVPAGSYELYLVAGVTQFTENSTTVVSVMGQADQSITWTGAADLPGGMGWASEVNYVKFDITLASPGAIAGTIDGGTDTSFLNGLQLVSVPEPSSATLLGLGVLALVLRRRK